MASKLGKVRVSVNGEPVWVPSIRHLKCPWCEEVVLDRENAQRLSDMADAIYREKYNLLGADEIRAIRAQFGLTQADLAQLLRLGANTVSRWESGRNVQSAAMNTVLCILRDLPGALEFLKSISGRPSSRVRRAS